MRILHVIYSLSMGGAEKLLTELVPQQCKVGYEVDVCVFNGVNTPFMESLKNSGINIITLSAITRPYDFRRIPKLRKLMRKYNIVHAHCTPPQYLCAIASVGINCKLITTEHNTNNRRRNKKWLKPIENWIYGRYSAIVGCSDNAANVLKSYIPQLKLRIKSISNGIDIGKYANAAPCDALPPRDANEFRLVMVGRFHHPKNQSFLIKSLAKLNDQVHLYLVGDGDTLNECISLASKLGIDHRVHFLGQRSDIPQILKSVDVMTHSSYWEGLPVSILEGMASGLPIVASNAPGIREIVNNAGKLFDPDSEEEFERIIHQVMNDTTNFEKLSKQSNALVKKYSIERMAESYMEVYRSV